MAKVDVSLVNLFGVAAVAFVVPFLVGFVPRLRVPAIVLEIVAGIIVGPSVLGWIQIDEPVTFMSTLGVAFLLFLAGMELDLNALRGGPLRLGAIGFVLSLIIALAGGTWLFEMGLIRSPLLVAMALASTSVGVIIPVLRDTGNLKTKVGTLTVAGGSAAEFGSIALLGVFFSRPVRNTLDAAFAAVSSAVVLVVFALVAAFALWLVIRVVRWEAGQQITDRLDATSSQLHTRLVVLLLLGSAVLATTFGFEPILGTFLAGIFFGGLIQGSRNEHLYRTCFEAMGFGIFVPVFFIASGMRLDLSGLFSSDELIRVVLFLALLLAARGLPALLYRGRISTRGVVASGLMQATNVSFIVVAVSVGLELGAVIPVTSSSLVVAGLLSAVLFPALAQTVLDGEASPHGSDAQADSATTT